MINTKMQSAFEQRKVVASELNQSETPTLNSFIERRDYIGAITLLKFQISTNTVESGVNPHLWLAYCHFHMQQYEEAYEIYTQLRERAGEPANVATPSANSSVSAYNNDIYPGGYNNGSLMDPSALDLNRAVCLLYMGQYEDACKLAKGLPLTPLSNRLLFHCYARLLYEDGIIETHKRLRNITADQMALGSVHFLRTHFQQAVECYNEILAEHPEYTAVNLHIAFCYYKMGEYDKCVEYLEIYRENAEDSFTSINLLACAKFKLHEVAEAAALMKELADIVKENSGSDDLGPLFKHNLCIFSLDNKESWPQILTPLIDKIPEARANLVKYYIEEVGDFAAAWDVVKNFDPTVSSEYTLRAGAAAFYAQEVEDTDILEYAQIAYKTVGESDADRDQVQGRRSMAASFFLLGEFQNVITYLNSINELCPLEAQEQYNLNLGLSYAAVGDYENAVENLEASSESKFFVAEHYIWLAKCLIRIGKAKEAFELFTRSDLRQTNLDSAITMLKVIANESFVAKEYQVVVNAANFLLKIDSETSRRERYETMLKAGMAALELTRRHKSFKTKEMITIKSPEEEDEY